MLIGYFIPHVALFTYKPTGFTFGFKPTFLDNIGNVAAVGNAIARFIISYLFKNRGFLTAVLAIIFLETVSALLFIPSGVNKLSYCGTVTSLYMTFGGSLGLYPLVSDTLFRSKGAFSYSILFSSFTISDIFILENMKRITDYFFEGSQEKFMRFLAILALVPLLWVYFVHRRI